MVIRFNNVDENDEVQSYKITKLHDFKYDKLFFFLSQNSKFVLYIYRTDTKVLLLNQTEMFY